MAVLCSRCSNQFEPTGPCPRCGASAPTREADAPVHHGPRWQQTVVGRLLIGMILSQGLFYGLRFLLTGVLLAALGEQGDAAMDNPAVLHLMLAIQFGAVFVGAMLAGGAQSSGFVIGAIVGVWSGVLALLAKQLPPAAPVLVGGDFFVPVVAGCVGLLAGALGSLIWQPIPGDGVPAQLVPVKKAAPKKNVSIWAGRILWIRAFVGAALMVAGTLYAAKMIDQMTKLSGGKFGPSNNLERLVFTWELKALAVFFGGVVASFSAPNGLKQGLVSGLVAASVLIGLQANQATDLLAMAFFSAVATMCFALVGGWFGGKLFPPVLRMKVMSRD